jgi:hypothetical protein
MDVLIMLVGIAPGQGGQLLVNGVAIGRFPDGTLGEVSFSVAYVFGSTVTQQRTAVIAAAKAAAEGVYGKTVPVGARVEIFGL